MLRKELMKSVMNTSVQGENIQEICNFVGKENIVIREDPSDKLLVNFVVVFSANGISMITAILLNAISVITVLKSSQMKNKLCYFIILVQSVIDLAVGVFAIPLFLVYLVGGITETMNCFRVLALRTTLLPIGLSSITLSVLTMDRYIAVLHPFLYSTRVTKKRILIYVGCGSVLMISIVILSFANKRLAKNLCTGLLVIVFIFIVFAYTKIFLVVRNLSRERIWPSAEAGTAETMAKKKLLLQEIKQANSCFVVAICFFTLSLLLPFLVHYSGVNQDKTAFHVMKTWMYTLAMCNSSVNSVIFFWTKKMLRREALKMFKHWFTRDGSQSY